MSPKESNVKRRRGRPPASSAPPPPPTRKPSSRIAASNDRKSISGSEVELPRKRGRPAASHSHEDSDAKRRRDRSPTSSENIDIDNDGFDSDVDEAGETKIDANGILLGDREFKVPTFTLPDHGDQVLMLAMDPTRELGYRDSYLLFQRHPTLKRVRINDDEKKMLVDMGLLVNYFKNRDVAVVTARSVFKCFGYKIIKQGRRVKDDYFESKQDGQQEGSSSSTYDGRKKAVSENDDSMDEKRRRRESRRNDDAYGREDEDTSRHSLIGKTARSESYSTNMPLNQQTWMYHAVLATRGFNAQLHERRAEKPLFYDIHSNVNQIPSSFQSTACHFEFSPKKDNSTPNEPIIEFKKPVNAHHAPLYRGLGKDLLDFDVKAVLEAMPDDQEGKEAAAHILEQISKIKTIKDEDDDNYPLALMEGQFQAKFPMHQTRFNFPVPKIPDPANLVDTAQSLTAQQYYLNLVYQSVNQYANPQNQSSAPLPQPQPPMMGRAPQNFSPMPPQPQFQPQLQPQSQIMPSNRPLPPMNAMPETHMCGTILTGNQICRRPVERPGEKCQLHAPPKQMSDFAKGPPPAIVYSDNKCAECHELKAAESLFDSAEKHITDDFALVKCSKCTRKYHPICANLTTPGQVAAVESYPWSCPECTICCVCKSAGDETTLILCDGCDRGWHTGCCNPKVEQVPEGTWLCPLCANCHSCGEHGMAEESQYTQAVAPKSDRYKYPVYLATYCPKCYDNFKEDRFCPVCLKAYSEEGNNDDEENEMVACDSCDHWVHTECDETLTPERYQILCDEEDAKYSCPMCEERFKRLVDSSAAELALKGLSAPSGYSIGLLGGKIKTRGIIKYKTIKVGIPEINGTGIAEMPSS